MSVLHAAGAAAFAALAGVAVVIDWRYRRVPNQIVGLLLAATVLLAAAHVARGAGALGVAGAVARHAGVAAALAVGLWVAGVWPAGDAKLFMSLVALTAAIQPDLGIPASRYSLILLSNAFIVAALAVSAHSLPRLKAAGFADAARSAAAGLASDVPRSALMALASVCLYAAIRPLAGDFTMLASVAGVALLGLKLNASGPMFGGRRKAALSLLAMIALLRWLLGSGWAAAARDAVALSAAMLALNRLLLDPVAAQLDGQQTWQTPLRLLRPGTVLADDVQREIQATPGYGRERLGAFFADGLLADQLETVRAWAAERGRETLPTLEAQSFASWIVLGVVLGFWAHVNVAFVLQAAVQRVAAPVSAAAAVARP